MISFEFIFFSSLQVFAEQYEREQMVDVTLTCQGKFLKAHRMVLGACSSYFQARSNFIIIAARF
jgi:hypothetical protein